MKRDKWTVPIAEWTPEEHAEYESFIKIKTLWHESGAWRHMSMLEFVEECDKIIQREIIKK